MVVHKDEDSGYGVTFPDLPGCFTAGDSMEEALVNVQEAAAVHLEGEETIPPRRPSRRMLQIRTTPGVCGSWWTLTPLP